MSKEQKKEMPKERINQFIIECMFNKYFEEKDKIASVAPLEIPCNDKVPQNT